MARNVLKASDLSGLFIYQDKKRGTVYYDILSRKGYVLTSSDVKMYLLYTAMLPICIIVAFIITSAFNMTYVPAFFIFVALYLLAAVIFRFTFFYKLPEAANWKPAKKENIFLSLARTYTKQRLIVLIILLLLLTIMMPLYSSMEGFTGINLYMTYFISALTGVAMIITIIALIVKSKNNL